MSSIQEPEMPKTFVPSSASNRESSAICSWPAANAAASAPEFSVILAVEDATVQIVRELAIDGDPVLRTIVWSAEYPGPQRACDAYEALNIRKSSLVYWSVGVLAFGSGWLTPTIETLVAQFVKERDDALAKLAREDEVARIKADRELAAKHEIAAYIPVRNNRFLVTLEQGRDGEFWSISFKEKWERDRFWDWLGWQRGRFAEFAKYMKDGDRLELERELLREMLITEQAVKKQGLGSGGRRPLRFWRGEL